MRKSREYLVICLFSILLFIVFAEFYEATRQKIPSVQRYWLEKEVWDESNLAYLSDREFTHIGKLNDQILYRYSQKIDQFGNRHTPQAAEAADATKTVAFFGCSFVEGVGVGDDFTIPAQFAKLNPQLRVANYGKGGWAPNYVYHLMLQKNLTQHLKTEQIIGLQLFYELHIDRLRLSSETLTLWERAPYFELQTQGQDSRLTFKGNFFEVRPWPYSIYFLLSKTNWFRRLHPFLLKTKLSDIELTSALLSESSRKFRQIFPQSKFLTIFMDPERPRSQQVQDLFKKTHEDFLILKADLHPEVHQIKDDGHYTEIGNQYFAEQISQQIKDYL